MCEKCVTDSECDECGAGPGERCAPYCTAPFGPGGPHENEPGGGGDRADA
jgi:hypothetical protein